MRPLVLKMHVSIDGFVATTDGGVEWVFESLDEPAADWILDTLWNAGAHLFGAATFKEAAAHFWPDCDEVFAAPMNEIPKITFSTSLAESDWPQSTIVRGDMVSEITRLKSQPGKPLLAHGGARFAQALVRHQLVDEYRLLTHPVALGDGIRLFPADLSHSPLQMERMETVAFASGTVASVFRTIRTPA